MKRVQQQSFEHADCGVACVAMLVGCSYQQAFEVFGFAEDQSEFFTRHHQLISALEKLGCTVKRKRFRSSIFQSRNESERRVLNLSK